MRVVVGASLLVVAAALASCDEPEPRREQTADLSASGDIVAKVAEAPIYASAVGRVAARQNTTSREALDRVVFDALFAAGARADEPQSAEREEVSLLARALLRRIWLDESSKPITDDELDEATKAFWVDVQRPEGVFVVHTVVHAAPNDSLEHHANARQLAERLRGAVREVATTTQKKSPPTVSDEVMFGGDRPATDPAARSFREAVDAEPTEGLKVTTEPLPIFTAEGWFIQRGVPHPAARPSDLVAEFVVGVVGLNNRGDLSEVTQTRFGYHVIMLLARIPPKILNRADRMAFMRDEILRVRAVRHRRQLVERLRKATSNETTGNVDALLQQVRTSDEPMAVR